MEENSEANPGSALIRLRDLVEIAAIRPVVRLADVGDPAARAELSRSFVLTRDAADAVAAIERGAADARAGGAFVQGAYGSGKSHLLAYLYARFSEGGGPGGRRLAVWISLVDQPAADPLEEIVGAALATQAGPALAADLPSPDAEQYEELRAYLAEKRPDWLREVLRETGAADSHALVTPTFRGRFEAAVRARGLPLRLRPERAAILAALARAVAPAGYAGIVVVLDELSEFLKAKPSPRSFHEDVRYLQFLGEAGPTVPLYVVAALQERLEETGDVPQDAVGRIKDRFPARFVLGESHLREVVSRGVLRPAPGARPHVDRAFETLHAAFPQLPFGADEFRDLFPIHPGTLAHLERLRERLSHRRGALDFLVASLAGDPSRAIPAMLDEPLGALLTPDRLFPHFRTRLLEQPESAPIVRNADAALRAAGRRFEDSGERESATALVHTLALAALAPEASERTLSVRDLAHAILRPVSLLSPPSNFDAVDSILLRLFKDGAPISRRPAAEPADVRYGLEAGSDPGEVVRRRVEGLARTLFEDDPRLARELVPLAADAALPLASFSDPPRRSVPVRWQRTLREALILWTPLHELSDASLAELRLAVSETEADLVLVVAPPAELSAQADAFASRIVPYGLREGLSAVAFWIPRPPSDPSALRGVLARVLLRRALAEETGADAAAQRAVLARSESDDTRTVRASFRDAYLQGEIVNGLGELLLPARELAFLAWDRILERVSAEILRRRFPRHASIAPAADGPTRAHLQLLWDDLIEPGELAGDAKEKAAARHAAEVFAKPLGIARRVSGAWRLSDEAPRGSAAAELSAAVEAERASGSSGRASLSAVYRRLRKGELGLTRDAFDLLLLAQLRLGRIGAYDAARRLEPTAIAPAALARVTDLAPGDALPPSLQEALRRCALLPDAVRGGTFTLSLQDCAGAAAQLCAARLHGLSALVRRRSGEREEGASARELAWDSFRLDADIAAELARSIEPGLAPAEGLARFLTEVERRPGADEAVARLTRLAAYLDPASETRTFHGRALRLLRSSRLSIPDGERFASLRAARAACLAVASDAAGPATEGWEGQLRASLRAFTDSYREVYVEHHGRVASAAALAPWSVLASDPLRKCLEALRSVPGLPLPPAVGDALAALESTRLTPCDRLDSEALADEPLCACGLRLDDARDRPEPDHLLAGVRAAVAALAGGAGDATQARLKAASEALRRRRADGSATAIEQMSQALRAASADDVAAQLALIPWSEVRRALATATPARALSIDDLHARLAGRTVTRAEANEIFRLWAGGGAVDEWLDVRSGPPDPDEDARASLRSRFPGFDAIDSVPPAATAAAILWTGAAGAHALTESSIREVCERLHPSLAGAAEALREAARDAHRSPELSARLVALGDNALRVALAAQPPPVDPDPPRLASALAAETASPAVAEWLARCLLQSVGDAAPPRVHGEVATDAARESCEAVAAAGLLASRPRPPSPPTFAAWEAVIHAWAPIEISGDRFAAIARARNLLPGETIAARLRAVADDRVAIEESFARFFEDHERDWISERPALAAGRTRPRRPWRLGDVLHALPAAFLGDAAVASPVARIWIPGLRPDLWAACAALCFDPERFRVVGEALLWSHRPSTPEVQWRHLSADADAGAAETREPYRITEPLPEREELGSGAGGPRIIRVNSVLLSIRGARRRPADVLRDVQVRLARALESVAAVLPERTLVAVFSGSGFAAHPALALGRVPPEREDWYVEGGDTPWETVTPFSLMYRT